MASTFYGNLVRDEMEVVYFGQVRPGEEDRVLMRWKTGADQYRVVFGDLRASNVSGGQLLEIEERRKGCWVCAAPLVVVIFDFTVEIQSGKGQLEAVDIEGPLGFISKTHPGHIGHRGQQFCDIVLADVPLTRNGHIAWRHVPRLGIG